MTTQACSEARMPSGPQTGPVSQDMEMEKCLEGYAHTLPVVPVEVPEGFPFCRQTVHRYPEIPARNQAGRAGQRVEGRVKSRELSWETTLGFG